MKKIFFLLFFIGISLFLGYQNNQYKIIANKALAVVIVPCDPSKNTCSPGDTASCECGIGTIQCAYVNISGGACYLWTGSCAACPTPAPTCTKNCSGTYWCDTNCDEWTTVLSCPSNTCVKGSTKIATNTSACNGVGGLTCPKTVACTAGTGTTNASCGGNYTACQCNGSTCQTQGYYCSAGSCVLGWAGGTTCAQSSCNSGAGCTGGATPLPTSTPTPPPSSCGGCATVPAGFVGQVPLTCCPGQTTSVSPNLGPPPTYSVISTTYCCVDPPPPSTYTISGNVYDDYNGNMVKDAVDTNHAGLTVTLSTGATTTTDSSGNYSFSNLNSGSYSVTLTIPATYTLTTPLSNPTSTSVGPNMTVHFGIKPPAPTCSGGLTANPTSVSPGGTSTLTAVGCTTPTGVTPSYTYYDDSTIAGDSVTNNNTNTSAWTSPNPYWTQVVANPSVAVCNPGGPLSGALCTNYQTAVTIVPRFSIAGNVFVDQNKDGIKNETDANYSSGTSTIQIRQGSCGGALVQTVSTANGTYTTGTNLIGGTYSVCYTSLPTGYVMTGPLNGPPASFSVTVGNASTGGACSPGSNCDANGNITNLNYGITNSIPWIQTTGGDPYFGSGVSNPIPDNTPSCGAYMSLRGAGGSPGVVYTGNGSVNLGFGQASQNPDNWLAANVYTPKGSELKTSYNTMYQTAIRSGITPTPLGSSQCGAGGIANCVLSASLANGVYIANGNLTLTGASYTFPGTDKDYVILVNGDLNINTEIHVTSVSRNTVLFTASGNINIASSVGNVDTTLAAANIEGYYSTDKSFYVKSLDATGKGLNCPTSDRRLNVAGAIVVNASLTGGSFVNQRDLCSGNLECPASTVTERPDFILNSPEFLKSARRIWQEIAP